MTVYRVKKLLLGRILKLKRKSWEGNKIVLEHWTKLIFMSSATGTGPHMLFFFFKYKIIKRMKIEKICTYIY